MQDQNLTPLEIISLLEKTQRSLRAQLQEPSAKEMSPVLYQELKDELLTVSLKLLDLYQSNNAKILESFKK
jgi:hypothetical protein